jgi:hypothetical protein
MRKILYLLILTVSLHFGVARAQDSDEDLLKELGISDEEGKESYKFPDIKPESNIYLGYKFTNQGGSGNAFEYERMDDFPIAGIDYRAFKYPHRTHFDFNMSGKDDYQSDIHYAYSDRFIARWFNTTLFHNLDNIRLIDIDPSTNFFKIKINDSNEKYGVRAGINNISLRLKAPDFPAHLYFRGLFFDKDGSRQQRSLSGNTRITRSRNIQWNTSTYVIGGNSHLGHAEVDLSHTEKRFDVNAGEVMFDNYIPHNRIPELKGSSNVIKIHSNYNEKVVASATFSIKDRENEQSGATADMFRGDGSVQWTPLTRLSFFLRYSHTDIDVDNPGIASITYSNGTVITYPGTVKPSVSRTTDALSVTGRYYPERGVVLKAKYFFENIDRKNAEAWLLQESTRKNGFSLSADLRVVRGLDFCTEYTHRTTDVPSYNTEPDNADKWVTSLAWMPLPKVNLLAIYSYGKEKRNDLAFSTTNDAKIRETRTDNLSGSATIHIRRNLSLTANYSFMQYKIDQDIVYGSSVDSVVPMKDKTNVYSASIYYVPTDRLNLSALISHVKSEGEFSPDNQDLLDPVSIASFSRQEITETNYQISGMYEFPNGFSGGADLRYADVEDNLDNIHDSNLDGHAYIIMLRVKKQWE